MSTLTLVGKYYVDQNGNKWNSDYYLESEAENFSKTLKNCKDCVDCEYCTDCVSCKSCECCESCTYCECCEYCKFCENCNGCSYCIERKNDEGIYGNEI